MVEKFWAQFTWEGDPPSTESEAQDPSLRIPGAVYSWQPESQLALVARASDWTLFKWGCVISRSSSLDQKAILEQLLANLSGGQALRDCLEDMEGEFSLVLWHEPSRSLQLVSDPIGVVKLFYTRNPGGVMVTSHASEIVRKTGKAELSPEGLGLLFSLKGIPAPYSLIQGVSILPPATILELSSEREQTSSYWDLLQNLAVHYPGSFDQASDDLLQILQQNLHSESAQNTQPTGVYLSGGVDSALLLGSAHSLGIPVKAFSVGYNPASSNDETEIARANARAIGVEIEVAQPGDAELASLLDQIIPAMPEPVADASLLPHFFLARIAASQVGNTIVGNGSDNIFGGLQRFSAEALTKQYLRVPLLIRKGLIKPLVNLFPSSRQSAFTNWFRKAQKFTYGAELPAELRDVYWSRFMSKELVAQLFQPEIPAVQDRADELLINLRKAAQISGSDLFTTTYASLRGTFPIYSPQKLMTMTYLTGKNCHLAYMSRRMVNFAFTLPEEFILKNGHAKLVLREAARKALPEKVVFPKKAYFSPPIGRWLQGVFHDELLDTLRGDPYFNRPFIEMLLSQQFNGWRDWQWELWLIFMVLKWWGGVNR